MATHVLISRTQVDGRMLSVQVFTVSALRSLMQENHKFKVRKLRGKLQSNLGSQNNKVQYGGKTEVESWLALLKKRHTWA